MFLRGGIFNFGRVGTAGVAGSSDIASDLRALPDELLPVLLGTQALQALAAHQKQQAPHA